MRGAAPRARGLAPRRAVGRLRRERSETHRKKCAGKVESGQEHKRHFGPGGGTESISASERAKAREGATQQKAGAHRAAGSRARVDGDAYLRRLLLLSSAVGERENVRGRRRRLGRHKQCVSHVVRLARLKARGERALGSGSDARSATLAPKNGERAKSEIGRERTSAAKRGEKGAKRTRSRSPRPKESPAIERRAPPSWPVNR